MSNYHTEPMIQDVLQKQETQQLEIVAFGTISSGKSALLNALAGRDIFKTDPRGGTTISRNEVPWEGIDRVTLVDTPGLSEIEGGQHEEIAATATKDADVVLLVVDGPLRQSEFQLIELMGNMEKRVVICLNKIDWYGADEQQSLLGQLRSQTESIIERKGTA